MPRWYSLAAAGLAYWLLVATEGTYLGTGAVTRIYDWCARGYDRIKGLRFADEARLLGLPLAEALEGVEHPVVLDVATGTGRLPIALFRGGGFEGTLLGLDRAPRMLSLAARALSDEPQAHFALSDAVALPVAAASCHAVTCIEALEFMPRPRAVLREIRRVLRPGGVLLASNRVGTDAWLFPWRLAGRGAVERELLRLGFEEIRSQRWQTHYDLVWAVKPGPRRSSKDTAP